MKFINLCSTAAILLSSLLVLTNAYADSDHSLFDPLLKAHVADGIVDYPAIVNTSAFEQYIQELAKPLVSTDRNEQLAYWINAYNAFAIKGILDGRSPSTFLGRIGYFKKAKYQIANREINLYDLERKVIIPFSEPRIHFAINCASASCPKLLSEVYQASTLDQQLEKSTRDFIADPTRNRFDRSKKILYLSKIFDWFKKDFREHSGSVQKYIARYVKDPELVKQLNNDEYKIKYLDYDWSLNGKAPK